MFFIYLMMLLVAQYMVVSDMKIIVKYVEGSGCGFGSQLMMEGLRKAM
jgi:hypothetical protein